MKLFLQIIHDPIWKYIGQVDSEMYFHTKISNGFNHFINSLFLFFENFFICSLFLYFFLIDQGSPKQMSSQIDKRNRDRAPSTVCNKRR